MAVLVITGTGTGVGKTVTTAAVAAVTVAAGRSVAVLKPAQTGVRPDEHGDADEVARLAGAVTARELARYPEPLAPATAARRSGRPPVRPEEVAQAAAELAVDHDLVLVEGAGGLLVRFDTAGGTLADAARLLDAPVLVVASAGLGTLNTTELTAEALRNRGLGLSGVVIGSWPGEPDLASRCNLVDLPDVAGAPLLGAVPAGAGSREPAGFRAEASSWLAPTLGGVWDGETFTAREAAERRPRPRPRGLRPGATSPSAA
jgi:dethiobiotin synthetase